MVKQYQVRLSAQAQASLQHIFDYITEDQSLQRALAGRTEVAIGPSNP